MSVFLFLYEHISGNYSLLLAVTVELYNSSVIHAQCWSDAWKWLDLISFD